VTLTFDLVNLNTRQIMCAPISINILNIISNVTNSSQDTEQITLLTFFTKVALVTLTFDLVNLKSIGFLSSPRACDI